MQKTAIILFNLGGPDSINAIEPFLFNLFRDPDIFNLPFGQKLFAKLISRRRAPKVAESYKLIGGKSPLNKWTEKQRYLLETRARKINPDIDVYTAMRYWHPLTDFTSANVEKGKYGKIILLPLYPHYSITTTGSSFNEWKRHYREEGSEVVYINNYYDNPFYIEALNQRINEAILKFPEEARNDIQLVFSAHGTPVSLVKKGDLYSKQIKLTVEAVMNARNYSHGHQLCYQSKVGPVKWLEPATDKKIAELALQGKKNLLIIPVSFVSDHIETLVELNIEYRHIAEKVGIKNYIVMEGLNDSEFFIKALTELVKPHLLK